MERKKRICLVTDWYPTKKNPYKGIFFKDQAMALADHFDFIVVHYKEKRKPFLLPMKEKYSLQKVHEERNTVEYDLNVYFPQYTPFVNKFYDMYQKYVKHVRMVGVGEFVSRCYQKKKKRLLEQVFQKCFQDEFDLLYCVDAQKESHTLQCISEAVHKPYVVAEHAPFPWPGSTLKSHEKQAIENAEAFLAISFDKIRQVLLQNVQPKKFVYVGNLVDERQFALSEGSGRETTFLIVAAHSFYKNYDLFIEVFNRLTEITKVPFRVMVVGYASNKGYSKNTNTLEEKIKRSKFAGCAEMIPEISHDRIQEIYGRADAFVMTSIQEGMPVSALEAGCCGLPIFSTMCGGVEDYVNDNIGRIYRMLDSESFATGLKEYLEGKIVFDKEYIRNYIVEQYGEKAFTERMVKCFNDVIEKEEK